MTPPPPHNALLIFGENGHAKLMQCASDPFAPPAGGPSPQAVPAPGRAPGPAAGGQMNFGRPLDSSGMLAREGTIPNRGSRS